jgi:hypothetical protein
VLIVVIVKKPIDFLPPHDKMGGSRVDRF